MKKASNKDIVRTIWKEKKRFFSIMMITILGVTLMTGLEAGCRDLRYSADRFFDEQELFDISIMSTLGLTDDDVKEIQAMEGVEKAEGSYSEIVHTKKGDANKTAEVKVMQAGGMNIPYLVEGHLPAAANEIVVTANYMKETGKQIGDTLIIEEMMDEDSEEDGNEENKEAEADEGSIEENETGEADEGSLEESKIGEAEVDEGSIEENETGEADEGSLEESKIGEAEETDAKMGDSEDDISLDTDTEIELEEEETPNFPNTEFVITGVIIDVMDINNAEGSAAFRATPNADYTFFVIPEAVDSEVYTTVYASVEETSDLLCYSEEYEERIASIISVIETDIMEQREQARYKEITDEAYGKIAEKEEEMYQEFADIEEEFADAREEINDGWKELTDGKQELSEAEQEAKQEIADARKELEDAYTQLSDGWVQLNEAEKQLNIGEAQLEEGKEELRAQEAAVEKELAEAESLLNSQIRANEEQKAQIEASLGKENWGDAWPESVWNNYIVALQEVIAPVIAEQVASQGAMSEAEVQQKIQEAIRAASVPGTGDVEFQMAAKEFDDAFTILGLDDATRENLSVAAIGIATCNATTVVLDAAMAEFNQQKAYAEAQIAAGWAQLAAAEEELKIGREQLSAGREEVINNLAKWEEGVAELDKNEKEALETFADKWAEIADSEQELLDGEQELEENRVEYEEEKVKAEDKIAEAKEEVADIDMTKWYVQDRTSLSGYVNVKSDTDCIESLASVFAVVFFIVAILISLTTVTRMVEEERGLIGTYKALGFTDGEIRRKYVVYAFGASFVGSILGDVGGFVILPYILFVFFKVMYLIPSYFIQFDVVSGTVSGILFMIGIVGAAAMACRAELKHLPANLMRPKAPKMGSRVFLERITFIWKRLSFLNKVTARNLFRYKKRLIMTVLGIMGCTALVLFGLAIKDSVAELMPLQYENVYKYDLLAAGSSEDNDKLLDYMENNAEVTEYINIQVENVKLKNQEGDTEKVQLMIFQDEESIAEYLTLNNIEMQPVEIGEKGIYLTENAAKILGLSIGDTAFIQNIDLEQEETVVTELVKNYLGNNIYMSQTAYEELFGEYKPNGVLANLADSCTDQIGFADILSEEDWILSAVSTEDLKEGFSAAFTLINLVVYVVLVLAAGLAFVVLFTLASINISERIRELATIKVLGFYDREVHSYVNKETMILTALGILLGLPVGAALSSTLTTILNLPSIYFAVTIYPRSYFLAAGISFVFAILVQFLTDRSLNVIDPVEALKSVE